jgi:hypothetical protein
MPASVLQFETEACKICDLDGVGLLVCAQSKASAIPSMAAIAIYRHGRRKPASRAAQTAV